MNEGKKVLVAMSGGVDSAVAAYLLKENGFDCIGATMLLFEGADHEGGCRLPSAASEARAAARQIGIPHYVFDFSSEFEKKVIGKFRDSYMAGLTPNPCIDCNRFIKFGLLLSRADLLGIDFVATGHYARIAAEAASGRKAVMRAASKSKDQSYVLSFLGEEALSRVIFPLGELTKDDVRDIARRIGLQNHDRAESQDICFIPDGDYGAFLERYPGPCLCPGDILSAEGEVIGRHRGAARYTIGQRRGLGVSSERRLFVTEKSMEQNSVTLGPREALLNHGLLMDDIVYSLVPAIDDSMEAMIVTRYHQPETPCTVYRYDSGKLRVELSTPVFAVTPGQAAVLYKFDTVLCAGTIVSAF